ncbi:MAG: acyl carrier protein [Clostridia bacterium]|nr:acyl carrier protein [Clostridia bacterium]
MIMIEKVKDLLAKQLRLDVDTIEDDANILDDLGADSLEVVEMLMTLESEFGIIVPDEDVMELKTVRAVADYIESHS